MQVIDTRIVHLADEFVDDVNDAALSRGAILHNAVTAEAVVAPLSVASSERA